MESMYPEGWPRCPVCGDYTLDGHITCGRTECDESGERGRTIAITPTPDGPA